jgi:hypothetical protein
MAIDKWSLLDYGKTAHWWVGSAGTACGRDFKQDIRIAYADDPRCPKCLAYLDRAREAGLVT